jgi:hypothetical protein
MKIYMSSCANCSRKYWLFNGAKNVKNKMSKTKMKQILYQIQFFDMLFLKKKGMGEHVIRVRLCVYFLTCLMIKQVLHTIILYYKRQKFVMYRSCNKLSIFRPLILSFRIIHHHQMQLDGSHKVSCGSDVTPHALTGVKGRELRLYSGTSPTVSTHNKKNYLVSLYI